MATAEYTFDEMLIEPGTVEITEAWRKEAEGSVIQQKIIEDIERACERYNMLMKEVWEAFADACEEIENG